MEIHNVRWEEAMESVWSLHRGWFVVEFGGVGPTQNISAQSYITLDETKFKMQNCEDCTHSKTEEETKQRYKPCLKTAPIQLMLEAMQFL